MKIEIKNVTITNFKGIKSLSIDFDPLVTSIHGANETGKTSVVDAINWLWFGKNTEEKKDFSVKYHDANNQTDPKLEVDVKATYSINGIETQLRRRLREKWVTRRGSVEEEFKGNETITEWGDGNVIPISDFDSRRNEIITQHIFKLATNPLYFTSLAWEKQRSLLIEVAGNVTNEEIINGTPEDKREMVQKFLDTGKREGDIKKELYTKITAVKKELDLLPSRIDEAKRLRPEVLEWNKLESEIKENEEKITNYQNQINDKSKAIAVFNESRIDEQKRIAKLKELLNELQFEIESENYQKIATYDNHIKEIDNKIIYLNNEINSAKTKINSAEVEIIDLKKKKDSKLNAYKKLKASVFALDENAGICPTCKQDLPSADRIKSELESNFNTDKAAKLEVMLNEGKGLKEKIAENETTISDLTNYINDLNNQIIGLRTSIETNKKEKSELESIDLLSTNQDYQTKKSEYEQAKEAFENQDIEKISVPVDLAEKQMSLIGKNKELQEKLHSRKLIELSDNRLKELETEQQNKALKLAELEKRQFVIETYSNTRISLLESKINALFSHVQFKLFEHQINGGVKETCVALINGVPFSDANTASKLNAGLSIINVFCKHFDFYSPIFIDNRESVTKLIDVNSQLINLFVSPLFKKLEFGTPEEMEIRRIQLISSENNTKGILHHID